MIKIFKNKKQKAIITIVFWLIFMGGVYLYIQYEQKRAYEYQKEYLAKRNFVVDFDYVKSSLLNKDFHYLYIIVDNDIISYEGNKTNNKYTGFVKENNIKKTYDNLNVLNKKYAYLSLDKLLSYEYEKGNNIFLYENDDLYVKIRVSIDNKVNIEVNDKKVIYQLEISNINGFDIKGSE